MTPYQAAAIYVRQMNAEVSISGVRSGLTMTADNIRGRLMGYTPLEISGTILQGDQKLVVMKSDLDDAGFPTPRKGDKVTSSDNRTLTVQFVDADTRRCGDTLIAYECQVRG